MKTGLTDQERLAELERLVDWLLRAWFPKPGLGYYGSPPERIKEKPRPRPEQCSVQGYYRCMLEEGHEGWHRWEHGGDVYEWKPGVEDD